MEAVVDLYERPGGGVVVLDQSGHLYVLESSGALLGQIDLREYELFSTLSGMLPERFYAPSSMGRIYCIGLDGKVIWSKDLRSGTGQAMGLVAAAAADGGAWALSDSGEVFRLSPQGETVGTWQTGLSIETFGIIYPPHQLVPDSLGRIYAASKDTSSGVLSLVCIWNGQPLWQTAPLARSIFGLDCIPDGGIFATAHQDAFYAFRPDGAVAWSWRNEDPLGPEEDFHFIFQNVTADGRVYLASGSQLCCFDSAGNLLEHVRLPGEAGVPFPALDGSVMVQVTQRVEAAGKVEAYRPASRTGLDYWYEDSLVWINQGQQRVYSFPPDTSIRCSTGLGQEREIYGVNYETGDEESPLAVVRLSVPSMH